MGPFLKRKEILLPTWRGWLALAAILVGAFIGFVKLIPPFLSPHQPLHSPVLAVEGWANENVLEFAVKLSAQTNYQLVVVTGGPIEKGTFLTPYETYANLGASRMRELGFKGTNLAAVPAPKIKKDRTYHSALALKAYLMTNTTFREIDLVSAGVHSRRSWLLFSQACKPEIKVGIIPGHDPEFDLEHWWRTSYGVRGVLNEAIGYVYAKTVFVPE